MLLQPYIRAAPDTRRFEKRLCGTDTKIILIAQRGKIAIEADPFGTLHGNSVEKRNGHHDRAYGMKSVIPRGNYIKSKIYLRVSSYIHSAFMNSSILKTALRICIGE